MKSTPFACAIILPFISVAVVHARVPQLLNYQGRIGVESVNFDDSAE